MGIRKGVVAAAAAVLGAAVAVLPAVALSETQPTIEAQEPYSWHPAAATVSEGGTVTIANNTGYLHGVEWRSPPETPTCSKVPVGSSGTTWSGTCT
ncbi:MAG TPA: hypothetical protein VH115_04600, partial [Solirubrobacteraceae bacterium]|nr:hypothetical protein [Solirubrobacteraceae bacterium]